jgi:hypothetical protein
MVYILIHNNQVVNGPRAWSYRSFMTTLTDDLGIQTSLPYEKTDEEILVIDENTKIMPATLDWLQFNPKIEYLDGPFWDFSGPKAVGTYQKSTYPVEAVKGALKQTVAANRWVAENNSVKVTVQGVEVTVDSSRDGRAVFNQQYLVMGNADQVLWKFPEEWITLSKSDIHLIIAAILQSVQQKFQWELDKCAEIDSCTTIEQLDQVNLYFEAAE